MQSFVDRHLGWLHILAVVNWFRKNWDACIFSNYGFLWIYAQEWDSWIIQLLYFQFFFFFFFERNIHYSPQWLYQLHFYQQCRKVSFTPHLLQHLLLQIFFDDGLEFLFLIKLKAFNFNSLNFHCLNFDVHVFLIVWNILSVQYLFSGIVSSFFIVLSCVQLLLSHELQPSRLPFLWDSPVKNNAVGCHFLPRGTSRPRN